MKFLPALFILFFFYPVKNRSTLCRSLQKPLLVVDGTIENGRRPVIFLSTSLDYFSKIDFETLAASIVSDAKVLISDGVTIKPLKEYTQQVFGNFNLTYYSSDTTNAATDIVGEIGKTYKLQIYYNNEQVHVCQYNSIYWKDN